MSSTSLPSDDEIIAKIETVIAGIVNSLEKQEPMTIALRLKPQTTTANSLQSNEGPAPIKYRHISWPGKAFEEAKKFSN